MKKIVALVLAMVMVLGLATTAFAAKAGASFDEATNKYWDYEIELDDAENAKDQTFATYDIEAISNSDKAMTWWEATPTNVDDDEDFDLGTFVKTDAKNATFVLVDGKTVSYYMNLNGAKELEWDATAVKFTLPGYPADTGDLKCNTLYNKTTGVAGTYYFDAKEFAVYRAVKATGATNEVLLNVDGVAIYGVEVNVFDPNNGYVTLNPHSYIVNWADRGYENETAPTKVYCQNCKAEFEFVYGEAEDAFDKFGLDGYVKVYDVANSDVDVYIASTLPVNHPALAAVAPSAPSADDTVTSPKTFDAGIAMYVGMSVMAAAGSAVVLKKKD